MSANPEIRSQYTYERTTMNESSLRSPRGARFRERDDDGQRPDGDRRRNRGYRKRVSKPKGGRRQSDFDRSRQRQRESGKRFSRRSRSRSRHRGRRYSHGPSDRRRDRASPTRRGVSRSRSPPRRQRGDFYSTSFRSKEEAGRSGAVARIGVRVSLPVSGSRSASLGSDVSVPLLMTATSESKSVGSNSKSSPKEENTRAVAMDVDSAIANVSKTEGMSESGEVVSEGEIVEAPKKSAQLQIHPSRIAANAQLREDEALGKAAQSQGSSQREHVRERGRFRVPFGERRRSRSRSGSGPPPRGSPRRDSFGRELPSLSPSKGRSQRGGTRLSRSPPTRGRAQNRRRESRKRRRRSRSPMPRSPLRSDRSQASPRRRERHKRWQRQPSHSPTRRMSGRRSHSRTRTRSRSRSPVARVRPTSDRRSRSRRNGSFGRRMEAPPIDRSEDVDKLLDDDFDKRKSAQKRRRVNSDKPLLEVGSSETVGGTKKLSVMDSIFGGGGKDTLPPKSSTTSFLYSGKKSETKKGSEKKDGKCEKAKLVATTSLRRRSVSRSMSDMSVASPSPQPSVSGGSPMSQSSASSFEAPMASAKTVATRSSAQKHRFAEGGYSGYHYPTANHSQMPATHSTHTTSAGIGRGKLQMTHSSTSARLPRVKLHMPKAPKMREVSGSGKQRRSPVPVPPKRRLPPPPPPPPIFDEWNASEARRMQRTLDLNVGHLRFTPLLAIWGDSYMDALKNPMKDPRQEGSGQPTHGWKRVPPQSFRVLEDRDRRFYKGEIDKKDVFYSRQRRSIAVSRNGTQSLAKTTTTTTTTTTTPTAEERHDEYVKKQKPKMEEWLYKLLAYSEDSISTEKKHTVARDVCEKVFDWYQREFERSHVDYKMWFHRVKEKIKLLLKKYAQRERGT